MENTSICRCCATEGSFKDIKNPYYWMGEEEVYADIIQECFDIKLSSTEQGGICEVCITQLRNASNFKKQVLNTEEQFKKHIQDLKFKATIVKEEVSAEEDDNDKFDSDDNLNQDDDDEDYVPEYEIPIKTETLEVKPKKRSSSAKATTSKSKKSKNKDEDSKSEDEVSSIEDENEPDEEQNADKIKHNVLTIIKMSNATPILKEVQKKYFCVYCSFRHPNPIELKTHVLKFHDKIDFLSKPNKETLLIKLDITGLICNICKQNFNTHEEFIQHLINEHHTKIHNVKNPIIPFKFDVNNVSKLNCVFCNVTCNSFAALVSHTSNHYTADFVCEKCGMGCISRKLYTEHLKTHKRQCQICRKIFCTKAALEIHHLTHTGEKKHQCDFCKKMYKTKTSLIEHMKIHLNIRNYKCKVCGMTFVQKASWKSHMKCRHKIEIQ